MIALYHREITGEGQHVDVSIQEAVAPVSYMATSMWDMMRSIEQRGGVRPGQNVHVTRMWPCKDGLVYWHYWSGSQAKRFHPPLIEWMDSEGMADDFLKEFDWDTFDFRDTTQGVVDRLGEPTRRFFMSHTKAELYEGGLKHRALVYPIYTTKDIVESIQLSAREFWAEVEHPELGTTITYPGPFARTSEAPPRVWRRAPLIGEHNREIYEKELGLSREELLILKQAKVI